VSGSARRDPYGVLKVTADATDAELRAAYRRAVQREHPDHNGGSPESERRFEAVQEAYAQIRAQRASGGAGASAAGARPSSRAGAASGARRGASTTDPRLDARLAAMEAELSAARDARERVRRAARDAARDVREAARDVREAARGSSQRPSDEELGYVTSGDSLGSIFDDTVSGLSEHLSAARRRRDAGDLGGAVTDKMADVFEDISARLRGERRGRPDG